MMPTPRKPKSEQKKRGPKPKKRTPIDLDQIETMGKCGLIFEQVGHLFGYAKTQFYELAQTQPEIRERYEKGKAQGVEAVSQALMGKALKGDTVAAIFYLKCQGKWRDNTRIEITGADGEPIKVDNSTEVRNRVLGKLARFAHKEKTAGASSKDDG